MTVFESPEYSVANIIRCIGDNPLRPGLMETPDRVVSSWKELFAGYNDEPGKHLEKQFDVEVRDMPVFVNNIEFFSMCEHHMLPFFGTVDIAYMPAEKVVGLSKFARLVHGYARRLQVQERLTGLIHDAINEHVRCHGVGVRVRAKHFCMLARGVQSAQAHMTTMFASGCFETDPTRRQEWLAQLPRSDS
jgi:GTP cyclohydrolase IA